MKKEDQSKIPSLMVGAPNARESARFVVNCTLWSHKPSRDTFGV